MKSSQSHLIVSRDWTAVQLQRNLARVLNPVVCQQVLAAMKSPSTDFSDVASMIQGDPYVAAKVVGMANIIARRQDDLILTIDRAVQVLGMEHVRSLILSVMMTGPMLSVDENVPRRRDLWRWVLGCGVASDLLLQFSETPDGVELNDEGSVEHLVTGLIMGLGALILYAGHGRGYSKLLGTRLRPVALAHRELKAMKVTHHQVTLWALEEMKCPPELGVHTQALVDGGPEPSYLFARSTELLGAWVAGLETGEARAWLFDGLPRIGIDPTRLEEHIGPMRQRLRELARVFDMDLSDWKQSVPDRLELMHDAARALESLLVDRLTLAEAVGVND